MRFELSVPPATMLDVARNCLEVAGSNRCENPGQIRNSGKVPKTHSVGSVGDHNLGVFAITEIALKIAHAVPPTHFISGAPNTAYVDL
jgi:hypothetical protein